MATRTNQPTWPAFVDIVVVGAGFTGLSTASELQQAGLKCVVLEAQGRIGGKSYTKPLQSGSGHIDMGCTWINGTTQKRMWRLTQKHNIVVKEQLAQGKEIFEDASGELHAFEIGTMPTTISTRELDQYTHLIKLINQECAKLAPNTPGIPIPGLVPLGFLDITVEQWLDDQGAEGFARFMIGFACSGVIGVSPQHCGLYYFLEMVRSCGCWEDLVTDTPPNGGQHYKIKTGTSSIAHAIAGTLKQESIFLNSPVQSILQSDRGCIVTTSHGRSVVCQNVVVAIPTNQYHRIEFQPPLPEGKRRYLAQCKDNFYAKAVVSYVRPWWRDLGLVGKFSSMKRPIGFTWDICDLDTEQYSLALFCVADQCAAWTQLNRLEREQVLLDHLADMVGPEHRSLVYDLIEYNEQDWGRTEYIGGACYPALGGWKLQHSAADIAAAFSEHSFRWDRDRWQLAWIHGGCSRIWRARFYRSAGRIRESLTAKSKLVNR